MKSFENTRMAKIEWPTFGLVAGVYFTLIILVSFQARLPWWVLLPLGAYAAALHASLQHEVLHGHPTRSRLLNEALVFFTPTFWLPYHRYRDTHLKHHNDINLTCPMRDPESYYLLPDDWAAMPGVKRGLFALNQTLCGRMLIGPAISVIRFWCEDLFAAARDDYDRLRAWVLFAISCGCVLLFIHAAGMPVWKYYVLVAYPGISLALVRSYCEHQAAADVGERTIIVEAWPFWSLLFLNNNLHIAHHAAPSLPWYRLPAYYTARRTELIRENNGYLMNGYGEIFRRFLFRAKEPIPHPNLNWIRTPGDDC